MEHIIDFGSTQVPVWGVKTAEAGLRLVGWVWFLGSRIEVESFDTGKTWEFSPVGGIEYSAV
jgi:hypothetical protein